MTDRTAVIFNANDGQLPQAHLFVESLHDPRRGDYSGDIWVVSTRLSSQGKSYADMMNIRYIVDPMDFLWDWSGWRVAAEHSDSFRKSVQAIEQERAKIVRTASAQVAELEKARDNAEKSLKVLAEAERKARDQALLIRASVRSCLRYLAKSIFPFLREAGAYHEAAADHEANILRTQAQITRHEEHVTRLEREVIRAREEAAGVEGSAKEESGPAREKALKKCFVEYRNKRQSKLLFLNFLEAHGADYQKVILCDTDIIVQSPIEQIFDQVKDDRLYYWREEYPILPGTFLWRKNLAYKKLMGKSSSDVDLGIHEMNIGFLAGRPQAVRDILSEQKKLYLAEEHVKLLPDMWHEQDYFRILRGLEPDRFALFQEGSVIHLCNGGSSLITEAAPLDFRYVDSGARPTIVHFAGGTWAPYNSINNTYKVDPDDFFSYYLGDQ